MRRRRVFGLLIAVTLAPGLAGCGSLSSGDDPIAVRLHNGSLEVAVCTPWSLSSVLVQTRVPGFTGRSEDVWVADGTAELASGDVLRSSSPPAGLEATSWVEPQLGPGDELTVTLGGPDGTALNASLSVPLSGLPTEEWLQADGSVTKSACPRD